MEKRSLTWLQTKHSHTLIQVVNRVFVVHILLIQVIEPTKKYKCDIQLCYNNRKTKWELYLVCSELCSSYRCWDWLCCCMLWWCWLLSWLLWKGEEGDEKLDDVVVCWVVFSFVGEDNGDVALFCCWRPPLSTVLLPDPGPIQHEKILIRNLLDSVVIKNNKIQKRISYPCIPEALLTTTVAVLEVELLVEVGLHASGCEGSVVVSFLLALCSYSTQMLPFSPIL